MTDRADLSVDGVLSLLNRHLSTYEHRPQQIELAHAIERAFSERTIGIFEAGTGTGKSFAALIPAILSGKKVVVSTNTISLQEQYIRKDIPTLKSILPFQFEAVLLKGRGNYLGLRRWEDHLLEQAADDRLIDWVHNTASGDISELDFVPPLDVWTEINSDSDDCMRQKCPHYANCFYFEAKRQAEKADIIVVNHALLLADAASDGFILPPYDYLIVDEAHHLPDVATDVFSASVSSRGIRMLASKALKKVQAPPGLIRDIEFEANEFFHRLSMQCPAIRTRFRHPVDGAADLGLSLQALEKWLDEQTFEHVLDVGQEREKAKLRARALLTTVKGYINCLELMADPSPEWVVWAERGDMSGQRFEVVAAPLDVASYIRSSLLSRPGTGSSVFMSATMATGGEDPFSFFKRSTGIEGHVIQARVSSPFNFQKQALLYLPRSLPEPNHPDFVGRAAAEIERILEKTRGRAFVLFTSRNALGTTYELLAPQLMYPCKKQGEMPRQRLIEWFKETPNAVLFGTASFWEGVSVEGEQLSCVIIDRIPFQSPDDPVYEARCDAMKDDPERSWFNDLALPHATMRLKQGVGRLIRTQKDCGLVALLDSRLTGKQYGRRILECMPPMTIIRSVESIESLDDVFGGDIVNPILT
ncbi:MAG TPA: helicase C-terminal domain-containing protein [Candidatus Obscuribacterales bacterium]